jgi:hypothetical protein
VSVAVSLNVETLNNDVALSFPLGIARGQTEKFLDGFYMESLGLYDVPGSHRPCIKRDSVTPSP